MLKCFTVTTNQSFWEIEVLGENLQRFAKIIWGGGDTVSIFEKQVGGVTTRI